MVTMPTLMRIGAVAGFLAPIVAFTCIFSAIASCPEFSWTNNALSDLGIVPGITSILFNSGLLAAGVVGLIFSIAGLYGLLGKRLVGKLGSAIFAAAIIALICIAIFNENYSPTHYLVSVAFFTLGPIALFILTCAFYLNGQRGLAVFSVAVGVVAALPWILEFTLYYVPGVAIPETVSALAVSVWVIVLATKMVKMKNAQSG
jgi:hypothetical membrane protein